MTRLVLRFCLAAALFAAVTLQVGRPSRVVMAANPDDPVTADLQKDWADQKARMVALADAMPADKYDFKATPPQRTYGEQLEHLADAHVRMLKTLDSTGKIPAPDVASAKTKDQVLKAIAAAYDYGTVVLSAAGPLAEAGSNNRSKARVVWSAMNNAMNHYGQCVVYLRLNGIVPPASR